MSNLGLNGVSSVQKNNLDSSKSSGISFRGSMPKDTFEFSGVTEPKQKVKTNFLTKLFSSLGSKTSETVQKPEIHSVWFSDDAVSAEDANSELAIALRSKTYVKDNIYTSAEYNVPLYSENAVKTMVKYAKIDPQLATKLENLFKYSESRHKDEDFEYLAQKQINSPDSVQKFSANCRGIDDYLYYLKAADKDQKLTDTLFEQKSKSGYSKFSPIETAIIVEDAPKYGVDLVTKYATEPRVDLTYRDIFELCEKDAEYSKEIEELLDFVNKNGMAEDVRTAYLSNILTSYIKDAETTKGLMKAGIFDKERLSTFSSGYVQAPEHLTTLLQKRNECKFDYMQNYDVVPFALKLQQYEQTIKDLTGSDYKDLSLTQLKRIVTLIEEGSAELKSIMEDK